MNRMLHITPQLPPAIDGVGDYCSQLRRNWGEPDVRWSFAVLHGAEATAKAWPEAEVLSFDPSASSLRHAIHESGANTVVLHYVGYGYQRRGIPLWLPDALENLPVGNGSAHPRLITFFHETYASSPPWRSPFWVKPWARKIMQRLVRVSDAWLTSCQRYHDVLTGEFAAEAGRGAMIPIGSNVPVAAEPSEERLWPFTFGRKLRVVIFGLPNTRLWALERHIGLLSSLVKTDAIESILLLGKSNFCPRYAKRIRKFQEMAGGEWHSEFDLPQAQVAETLAECDIGLIANDAGTLTKSGVFAALATNGVIGIISAASPGPLPPPFGDCVLANDDQPQTFAALLNELRGTNRMTARRRATLRLAQTTLAWPQIAASWAEFLSERGGPHPRFFTDFEKRERTAIVASHRQEASA